MLYYGNAKRVAVVRTAAGFNGFGNKFPTLRGADLESQEEPMQNERVEPLLRDFEDKPTEELQQIRLNLAGDWTDEAVEVASQVLAQRGEPPTTPPEAQECSPPPDVAEPVIPESSPTARAADLANTMISGVLALHVAINALDILAALDMLTTWPLWFWLVVPVTLGVYRGFKSRPRGAMIALSFLLAVNTLYVAGVDLGPCVAIATVAAGCVWIALEKGPSAANWVTAALSFLAVFHILELSWLNWALSGAIAASAAYATYQALQSRPSAGHWVLAVFAFAVPFLILSKLWPNPIPFHFFRASVGPYAGTPQFYSIISGTISAALGLSVYCMLLKRRRVTNWFLAGLTAVAVFALSLILGFGFPCSTVLSGTVAVGVYAIIGRGTKPARPAPAESKRQGKAGLLKAILLATVIFTVATMIGWRVLDAMGR